MPLYDFLTVLFTHPLNALHYIGFRYRCGVYGNIEFHVKVSIGNDVIRQRMHIAQLSSEEPSSERFSETKTFLCLKLAEGGSLAR